MCTLFDEPIQLRHLIDFCRIINNFFSFAGIGVSGGFQHFNSGNGAGPPAIAITGRTYHLMCDTEYQDHSIHWFLYDKRMRQQKAQEFSVHATVIQAITDDIKALELKDFSSNGDFAAIMHATNSTDIDPRSVVIRRRSHAELEFLDILSHHYEPLHYVLFFPHGDMGWGISHVDGVPNFLQVKWYRCQLLVDDKECFSILGRFCCEYLVDMYSRQDHDDSGPAQLQPVNEVNDYQKAHYLSAPEAAWSILNFEITRKEQLT
ncbi:hypothetical protein F4604DRAFT_1934357 [Suillus subluteus]|nr:hypothetical protein F4604DRAFT_1934357 [Suillus subluteus]